MPSSRRPGRARRARLTVQRLEPRDVPAGDVRAELLNGVLTLTGDDANNGVEIIVAAGAGGGPHVKLVADLDTSINNGAPGAEVTLDGELKSIKAVMNGGDDTVAIDSEIDLEPDADGVDDFDFVLPGAATFDMGDGDNTLTLDTTGKFEVRDLAVKGGDGFDQVSIKSPRDAGSGIATGRRQFKPVAFDLGDGGFDVDVTNFHVRGPAGVRVAAGDVNGDGITPRGTFTADGLTVDGAVTATVGEGMCSFSFGATNMGSFSSTGKGLQVTMGTGTHVKGDVNITGSDAISVTATGVTIDKSMKVQKKWLPANFRLGVGVPVDVNLTTCTVGGVDVSAAGGSTAATLRLIGTTVDRGVTFRTPGANSSATMTANGTTIGGAVVVQASGPGESRAKVGWAGDCSVGSVTIKGTDTAEMTVTGNLDVSSQKVTPDSPPNGDVSVSATARTASVTINGAGGGAGGALRARNVAVTGLASTTVSLIGSSLEAARNLTVISGRAALFTEVGQGQVVVGGAVKISGVDAVGILYGGAKWESGAVSVASRMGPVLMTLSPASLTVNGAFAVAGGATTGVTVDPTGADGEIKGAVSIIDGGGAGKAVFQDMHLRSTATFAMGRGDNEVTLRRTFVLPHVLEKSGRLSVTADNGNDTVTLDEVVVGGTSTIRTGAGKDTLAIDAATFKSSFTADLGGGDDSILVAQKTGAAGPVTFNGIVTVLAGVGNDSLRLGVADGSPGSDANTKAVFNVGGVKWDGGTGLNLFDPQAGQFELPAGIDPDRVFLNWSPTV